MLAVMVGMFADGVHDQLLASLPRLAALALHPPRDSSDRWRPRNSSALIEQAPLLQTLHPGPQAALGTTIRSGTEPASPILPAVLLSPGLYQL